MEEDWVGKAVSIQCEFGIFQGTIKEISSAQITIVRAFRNGVPLRKQDAEVTLSATDIRSLELIPAYTNSLSSMVPNVNKPTPVKQPNFAAVPTAKESMSMLTNKMSHMRCVPNGQLRSPQTDRQKPSTSTGMAKSPASSNVAQFFGNMVPPNVEVKLGTALSNGQAAEPSNCKQTTRPIDIARSAPTNSNQMNNNHNISNGNGTGNGNGNGNGKGGNRASLNNQRKKSRRDLNIRQNQTFGTPVDDPIMNEDFDFEGNLALFDKQAVWDVIDSMQKPDLVRPAASAQQRKSYRHDENILTAEPLQLRQIETVFQASNEFVTDQGLIIPTIPFFVRNKIQLVSVKNGLSLDRQNDVLARGTTDIALLLLGGACRLIPNNSHQWPTIVIVCDSEKAGGIGAATGRQLASHGLKVVLYFQNENLNVKDNVEIKLFKATNNKIINSVNDLPSADLVILSFESTTVAPHIKKWMTDNRTSVLAIDPPPSGFDDVQIKCSILPILPLNDISRNLGKLYLCNMGIPDQFYKDAGIVYKSPFGHKFVIQIHFKD